MRVTVFGAHGPTGRLVTAHALDAGHSVAAVTRRPDELTPDREGLTVVGADARDPAAVAAAVRGSDAVLSVLGVPFSKQPVDLFSTATRSVVEAMRVEGVKRLVVVSSSATYPHHHADAGVVFNRVLQPWVTRTIGRTVYDDMRRMEELVHASDLAWTVMRPSGLFDPVEPSTYELADEEAPGIFTARTDLAAAMVEVLDQDRYVHRNVAVTTTSPRPSLPRMILREAFGRG